MQKLGRNYAKLRKIRQITQYYADVVQKSIYVPFPPYFHKTAVGAVVSAVCACVNQRVFDTCRGDGCFWQTGFINFAQITQILRRHYANNITQNYAVITHIITQRQLRSITQAIRRITQYITQNITQRLRRDYA